MIQTSTGSFWSKNVILDCKILFKLGRAEEKRNSSLLLCARMHKSAAFKLSTTDTIYKSTERDQPWNWLQQIKGF